MTTPSEISQGLSVEAQIVLFELDLTDLGGTVLRFSPSSQVGGNISFGGNIYSEVEVLASGFEWSAEGPSPRPRLKVGNVGNLAGALVIEFGDLRGATLARIRTFRRFLDDGAEPDGTATLSYELYVVDRKVAHNKTHLEFELTSVLDQEGRMLPGRQVLKEYCTHLYRRWNLTSFDYTEATCPYTGSAYFTAQDVPTPYATEDRCSKLLTGCRKRFGQNGVLPTRAFPGVRRLRNV